MIGNAHEYHKALEELAELQQWLERLNRESPGAEKGMTKAGIRKLLARLHEELAVYEGGQEFKAARRKKLTA
jgi:hypothetical protein